MPFTRKQRNLFNAEAHNPDIAREHGTPQGTARKLADEANRLKGEGKERKPISSSTKADPRFTDLEPVFGAPTPRAR